MADGAASDDPAVQAQLDRLKALSPGKDVLGLSRMVRLLDRLGNPQDAMPPVFHVAGTNGKGSTCAFLRTAIEAAGLRAHVYSSPHLVRFNERIRLAGSLIEDTFLAEILCEVLDVNDCQASFFEITTAAAFLAFARIPADACIVEVGLGGRLDATNVIQRPAVCGIAALGIDHEAFLLAPEDGAPTAPLPRIAWEKAGIAKPGVPLVVGRYEPAIASVLRRHAAATGSPLAERDFDWKCTIMAGHLDYRDRHGQLSLPLPTLAGAHQADNAALAIAMLRHQHAIAVPHHALTDAMNRTHWPARLQRLNDGPMTSLAPAGSRIWLDGGHNANAGEAIAAHFGGRTADLHLIVGMLANKDAAALVGPLARSLASISSVPVPGHDWHSAKAFAACLPCGAPQVIFHEDVASALAALPREKPMDILIAGSLYLAGEVLRLNRQLPD